MKKLLLILCLFFSLATIAATGTEYHSNGCVKKEVVRINDDLYKVNVYYENGQLNEIRFYESDGDKTGTWINYNESGCLMYEAQFSNDKKSGTWKVYAEGKVSMMLEYSNGKRIKCYAWSPETGLVAKGN